MGSEKQKGGGGVRQQAGGKHSIRPRTVVFVQRGAGAKKNFAIFFAEPIFAKGEEQKINIFLRFLFFAENNTLDRELNISANS